MTIMAVNNRMRKRATPLSLDCSAGLMENQRGTFGRRVGKNVVIRVIKIWKFNFGSNPHWEKRRNKRQILLRDLFRRQRNWLGKRTIEINYRQRRLRGKNAALGDDLVTFRLDRRRMRFREFDASLDGGARQERNGKDGKNRV